MRRVATSGIFVLFIGGVVASLARVPGQTNPAPLRAAFALDFPDLQGLTVTAPEVTIPTSDLHTLRLRVRKPLADETSYGKIYTRINGEAAALIQSISSDLNGYIVKLDLDSRPRFKLKPGKNVIEIEAVDRGNKSYYASYVVLSRALPQPGAIASNIVIEQIPGTSNADVQPPVISLTQPTGIIRLRNVAETIRIQGAVTDDSGIVTSLVINNRTIPLAAGGRAASVPIDQSISVGPTTGAIVIEARDQASNVTRITIPVGSPEPALATQFKGKKFALVVGVSKYKEHDGGLSDLAFADADARAFRDYLQQPEGGGLAASDILYIENEKATIAEIRTGLRRFLAKAEENDLVLIYMAGHGGPDPYAPQNLYYMVSDSKIADLPNTALPMTELQDVLEHSIRARRSLVLIDTCHSAGVGGTGLTLTRGLENNLINLYAAKLFSETGRAVLTSSDVNEVSTESTTWGGGHGIFTWALLEGLRGKADSSADKLITAGELFAYVRDRVRVETGGRQNPRALPGLNADLTLSFVR